MIPKIIHQTWKTTSIPEEWQALVDSWKHYHPDWEYRFWSDKSCLAFVEQHYPEFLPTYKSYPYNIQRADAVRYLLLFHYGGLYVDMDFECLRSFDALIVSRSFLIACEPSEHHPLHSQKQVLCNALMGSRPNHPFLQKVIAYLQDVNANATNRMNVLETTGPLMLKDLFQQDDLMPNEIVPSNVFYPFNAKSKKIDLLKSSGDGNSVRRELKHEGAYAVHYWANSWVESVEKGFAAQGESRIAGFDFYPGVDSPGYNLQQSEKDENILADQALLRIECAGFNTYGMLKSKIQPSSQWTPMVDGEEGCGLYLKNRQTRQVELTHLLCQQGDFVLKLSSLRRKHISLDKNGKIGKGGNKTWLKWRVVFQREKPVLYLFGQSGVTAILSYQSDGNWLGSLQNKPSQPIHLYSKSNIPRSNEQG